MNNEIATNMAHEIRAGHRAAEDAIANARGEIDDAIRKTVGVAAMVDAAKAELGSRGFWDFWRDRVKLAKEEATRYLTLHKTAGRIDKRQLLLLGIVDEPETPEHRKRTPDPFAWCRLVPKINDAIDLDTVAKMDATQRAAARNTIKPAFEKISEIWEKLQ